jgi:hypothetical protein
MHEVARTYAAEIELAQRRAPIFGRAAWSCTTLRGTEQDSRDLTVLALPSAIESMEELSYLGLSDVLEAMSELAADDNATSREILEANDALTEDQSALVPQVRTSLLRLVHRVPAGAEEQAEHWLFFAILSTFDRDELKRSLSRQLGTLRALADLSRYKISIKYRTFTAKLDDSDALEAYCEVLCSVRDCSAEEAEQLREGFGQILHSALIGVYAFSFALHLPGNISAERRMRLTSPKYLVEIRRAINSDGSVIPFRGVPDYGHVDDFLKSLSFPVVLEMECASAANAEAILPGVAGTAFDMSSEGDALRHVVSSAGSDARRVNVSIRVGSDEKLPPGVAEFIGAQFGGPNAVRLHTPKSHEETMDDKSFTPAEALTFFHPPFGEAFRSTARTHGLSLPIARRSFPPAGVSLGTALIRHASADRDVDVRLTDADRARHLYVVGKTGTGKTNFLKHLVSQDLAAPGRGVIVLDPHGDLAEHAVNSVPRLRLDDVIYLDFGRKSETPVINPLSRARRSVAERDRTVQELLEFLRSRVYHQWTGPRFDDMVRLGLHTMLDEGYPLEPSIVQIPKLFIDETFQKRIHERLTNTDLKKRWDMHQRTRTSSEYGTTIEWMTSKFGDFSRDSILRITFGMGGQVLDLHEVLERNKILIVKIPESEIGADAANAIGSMLLLQLRGALFSRSFTGGTLTPSYVYIDEFQNFATTDIDRVVAEARKFGVGFVLAHQNLEQLREFSEHTGIVGQRLIQAILGNVATLVAFSVGAPDADALAPFFGIHRDLMLRISRYTALARTAVNGVDTGSFTLRTRQTVPAMNPRLVDEIESKMLSTGIWMDRSRALDALAAQERLADTLETLGAKPLFENPFGASVQARAGGSVTNEPTRDDGQIHHDLIGKGHATTDEIPIKLPRDDIWQIPDELLSSLAPDTKEEDRDRSAPARDAGLPITIIADDDDQQFRRYAEIWNSHVGPFVSIRRAAEILGVTESVITALVDQKDLLAVPTAENIVVLPKRQFDDSSGKVIPGLGDVLKRFSSDAVASQWTIAGWLFESREILGNINALQWLEAGKSIEFICRLADQTVERLMA